MRLPRKSVVQLFSIYIFILASLKFIINWWWCVLSCTLPAICACSHVCAAFAFALPRLAPPSTNLTISSIFDGRFCIGIGRLLYCRCATPAGCSLETHKQDLIIPLALVLRYRKAPSSGWGCANQFATHTNKYHRMRAIENIVSKHINRWPTNRTVNRKYRCFDISFRKPE